MCHESLAGASQRRSGVEPLVEAVNYMLRWWRTLHHLRPAQTFGRAAYELRRRLLHPALTRGLLDEDTSPVIALQIELPATDREELARGSRALLEGKALLAGHEVVVTDWNPTALPKLVRYHLHYLDPVRALVAASKEHPDAVPHALGLAHRWFNENPPGKTEGWEPYPVAARLQNLSILAARLGPRAPGWLARLLAAHCRYLQRWPETHLQGNHLLKDYLALALGGLVLEGGDAAAWREHGLRQTRLQLQEQLLPDGGHYERSPMYHALILWDLLDLRDFAAARSVPAPWLEEAIDAMARFLRSILHPDGEVPLFNDAVLGQAPAPATVLARAKLQRAPAAAPLFDAPQSGLTAIRPDPGELLLFDTGALGPPHQPGHAHSDTLSFELSIGGERRLVNSGMDGYQSPNRPFFRSAAAHNTVTVDGEGPDELWAAFRVGGRCEVTSRGQRAIDGGYELHGSLAAFQRWTQRRRLFYFPGRALVVCDEVSLPKQGAEVVSRARLAPGHLPLRFVPLIGTHGSGRTRYAPRFGEIREIDEHRVWGSGKCVRLAYALIWGGEDVQVKVSDGFIEVAFGGRLHRLAT